MVVSLANTFGLNVGSHPSTYLGLPLNGKSFIVPVWDPIIEKVERRLGAVVILLYIYRHTHKYGTKRGESSGSHFTFKFF